jgi:transposase InsO family protein
VALRRSPKLGPARIAPLVGLPTSTGYRVLCRHRLHRLAVLDRPTGEVIRRYERARPGELVHVDVKKLGRLRDGGGHRLYGRDSAQHRTRDRHRTRRGPIGYDYVHAAVDDHSHLAYAEVLPDEQAGTCAGFLRRAGGVLRRPPDRGPAGADRQRHGLPAQPPGPGRCRRTRRRRALHPPLSAPTNGKVERFNRTLLAEWAYVRPYATNAEPTGALDSWLHLYNHHRAHTALGGHPPISRLNNPPNSYT